MTAKEFLRQYEYKTKQAERLREVYQTQQEKIDAIGSTLSNDAGMPHGTGISRKTEDRAIKLAEAAANWKEAELEALIVKGEVFDTIRNITGIEGEILYQRYINLHKWEEICVMIPISWNGAHKAHRRALAIVEGILKERGIEVYTHYQYSDSVRSGTQEPQ